MVHGEQISFKTRKFTSLLFSFLESQTAVCGSFYRQKLFAAAAAAASPSSSESFLSGKEVTSATPKIVGEIIGAFFPLVLFAMNSSDQGHFKPCSPLTSVTHSQLGDYCLHSDYLVQVRAEEGGA